VDTLLAVNEDDTYAGTVSPGGLITLAHSFDWR
jgi:hypothetical protein